ncbi:MAG: cadmium-translocating P-type ATPase [Clostridia bacterium]|nr:cadmium-translocating P-type ATPase [Clostridia bacterium]
MSKKQKKELGKIIISLFFFVAAFFTKDISFGMISLSFLLSVAAFLVCGMSVLARAIQNLVRFNPLDEHFLMSVAAIGAFLIGEPVEAAAVMIFYQIGELFQGIAVSKSRKSIAALCDIAPDKAHVLRDGEYVTVTPDELLVGDKILIKPGERIPVDSKIDSGSSDIDTKAISGESMPTSVGAGSTILSGSVNLSGVLYATVLSTYENSTVAKILELTENTSSKKSTFESFIHRFALLYTPIVVCLAVLLAIVPSIFFGNFTEWIRRSLTFLVISCPCALVISVPLSFFAGLGRASSVGILIKGSNYLELLSQADTAVFDKTGTLTTGEFYVEKINPENSTEDELLKIAATLEETSNHPVAEPIKKAYSGELIDIKNEKELAGLGICADSDFGELLVGNIKLMKEKNIDCTEETAAGTTLYVAKKGKFLGTINLSDKVKENAKDALKKLKKQGIKEIVILTGDKKEAALLVCSSVSADDVKYELLPQDKVKAIEKIKSHAKRVIFAGDGINDAPVMKIADIAISMGQLGQDAAIEASDIVLTDDNLEKISTAIKISKKTVRTARTNIIFSIGMKVAVLLLGALGFANIWAAVFADVGVCVIAILNSVRLLGEKAV